MSQEQPPPISTPPTPPKPPRKDWMQRNWKWALPLGCFTAFLLVAGFFLGLSMLAFGMLRQSAPYTQALERVQSHPGAVEALGDPIEAGWRVKGSVNLTNDAGDAKFAIPVTGSKESGTLYVEATKQAGTWTFDRLELQLGEGAWLDLLTASPVPESEPEVVNV